eukprot:m.136945 g.136945  ORF g.136945 m.136945 type:complete len:51 (+) comp38197_c0_seq1:143-295(+)
MEEALDLETERGGSRGGGRASSFVDFVGKGGGEMGSSSTGATIRLTGSVR